MHPEGSFLSDALLLTARERQALIGALFGLTNQQIGARWGISRRTAEIHRRSMLEKMSVRTTAQLILAAYRS